jgi:hypothetical protein
MPWQDLAYFALMSGIALSILTICVGLTVRLFLGPILRDITDRMVARPRTDEGLLMSRIAQLDDRLAALEGGLDRIEAAQDFDRRLGAAGTTQSKNP